MKKTRRASGRKWFSWFYVTVAVVLVYFSSVLLSQQSHLNQVARSQAVADKRLEAAQQENERLKREMAALNDNSQIERLAREELGMTKQGELPYGSVRR